MNHPHRQAPLLRVILLNKLAVPVALMAMLGIAVPHASAQAAGAGTSARITSVKPDTKTAAALSPGQQSEVTAFITSQAKALSGKDDAAQQKARDALGRESAAAGGASPAYQAAFASALNAQLAPLAKSPNIRTRLNAAIALYRVAKAAGTNSAALEPAAIAFAGDASEAVALWAVKASQFIIPAVATTNPKSKLPGAIVAAAQKYSHSGDLVEEAYKALTPNGRAAEVATLVTPDVLKLFESRVAQFSKRTPAKPDLETRAITYLTLRSWDLPAGKTLQPKIMQAIANLISVAAQHAVARTDSNSREPFVTDLRVAGDAMIALGGRKEFAEFAAPGKSLKDISPTTAENEFTDRAAAAFDVLKAKFSTLTDPPKIDEGATSDVEEEVVEEPAKPATPATPAPSPAAPGKTGTAGGTGAAPAPAKAPGGNTAPTSGTPAAAGAAGK